MLLIVQVEKEPEKMDADAVRRTLESLVDTRPSRCRDHAYEFTRLDNAETTTSIIVSYHNAEFYSLKLALTAIVEHTPYDLYAEIVVLDDGTTDDHVRRAATAFLRDPKFNKVLCIMLLLLMMMLILPRPGTTPVLVKNVCNFVAGPP